MSDVTLPDIEVPLGRNSLGQLVIDDVRFAGDVAMARQAYGFHLRRAAQYRAIIDTLEGVGNVDRMAKAIYKAAQANTDMSSWNAANRYTRDYFRNLARAAMEVPR